MMHKERGIFCRQDAKKDQSLRKKQQIKPPHDPLNFAPFKAKMRIRYLDGIF